MDRELFLKLETVETITDDIHDYHEAICEMSRYYQATSELLNALIHSALAKEKQWQAIEQRPDFKEKYQSRIEARRCFLKIYAKENKK